MLFSNHLLAVVLFAALLHAGLFSIFCFYIAIPPFNCESIPRWFPKAGLLCPLWPKMESEGTAAQVAKGCLLLAPLLSLATCLQLHPTSPASMQRHDTMSHMPRGPWYLSLFCDCSSQVSCGLGCGKKNLRTSKTPLRPHHLRSFRLSGQ